MPRLNNPPRLTKPWKIECGTLNLDSNKGEGTHWTYWSVKKNNAFIFMV